MMQHESEARWLTALQRQEPHGYHYMYDTYFNQLYYFVHRSVADQQVAEDIVTDSFIKAFHRTSDFNSMASLKSFLFKVARNAAIDYLKTNKGHRHHHEQLRYLSGTPENDVEQEYIIAEAVRLIHEEIEKLPQQCREVIKRSLIEGQTAEEIATAMNIATKSVHNHKSRGMQQLRTVLLKNNLGAIAVLMASRLLPCEGVGLCFK